MWIEAISARWSWIKLSDQSKASSEKLNLSSPQISVFCDVESCYTKITSKLSSTFHSISGISAHPRKAKHSLFSVLCPLPCIACDS